MLAQADSICDRFERAWRAGERPLIEEYLESASEPGRSILFRELLATELELRLHGGERTDPQQYAARFPAHRALIGPVFDDLATSDASRPTPGLGEAPPPGRTDLELRPSAAAIVRRWGAFFRGHGRQGAGADPATALPITEQPGEAATIGVAGIGPLDKPMLAGLSQFELLSELGRGGMGVVYKARHRQLNRMVALKMLGDGKHALPENRARFLVEGEAVARLHHPNIVQIHEIGEADGHPFVTLEMLEGGSLADRLKGATQPGRAAAALVATLAEAIHAAHQAGIVHRDLKPSNILFDRDGVPKIVDFGLAKRLEVEVGQTQTGQVMGTPSYMAPEQAQGLTHQVGPRADIWALGAILYEMLTGRPPFKAPSTIETIHQVIYEEVVLPSRIQPTIARDLETIALKCLQKDAGKRYESAAALGDDLRRFQAGEPILARPVGSLERAWRWCRRNRALASATGRAASALVAISVLSITFAVLQFRSKAKLAAANEDLSLEQEHAKAALNKSQRLAAELALDKGQLLGEQEDANGALLWIARGLKLTPADAGDLKSLARSNLEY
jgi:eukaryotic-like serine/threonine-protein kinase